MSSDKTSIVVGIDPAYGYMLTKYRNNACAVVEMFAQKRTIDETSKLVSALDTIAGHGIAVYKRTSHAVVPKSLSDADLAAISSDTGIHPNTVAAVLAALLERFQ